MSFIKTYGRCYQKFDNDPIIKTDPTYTAPTAKENLEYTGEAQALLNAGSTSNGTIKYSLDGTNWSTSVPTGTEAQTYTVYWKLEGDANHNDVAQATISVEITSAAPTVNFVDLGLPSGKLWADRNVGADSEEAAGLYFQWGDTQGYAASEVGSGEGKKYFGWADYKYSNNGGSNASDMTKYNSTDGLVTLEAMDDAAVANMGGNWRMPTETEFNELLNTANCTKQWVTNYGNAGINGYLFTSVRNSNTLFFPVAGRCNNGRMGSVGITGLYWSSSLNASFVVYGKNLYFCSDYDNMDVNDRSFGCPVRAIKDPVQ